MFVATSVWEGRGIIHLGQIIKPDEELITKVEFQTISFPGKNRNNDLDNKKDTQG